MPQSRKYGVVIEEDYPGIRLLAEILKLTGAVLSERKEPEKFVQYDVVGWEKLEREFGRGAIDLISIREDLDLHLITPKRTAAEYVGSNSKSVDLVIMSPEISGRIDMRVREATDYMKSHGYIGWVALEALVLEKNRQVRPLPRGVNEIFEKKIGKAFDVIGYMVYRYRVDRQT